MFHEHVITVFIDGPAKFKLFVNWNDEVSGVACIKLPCQSETDLTALEEPELIVEQVLLSILRW